MYYRKFEDKAISALGIGCLRFPMSTDDPKRIDRVKGQAIIDKAFEYGINYFDTAYTYQDGDSERFLGEALSQHPRDSYYLATKFYAAASKDIRSVFEEQLRRLQTDYFDFYLLHGVDENHINEYMNEENGYWNFLQNEKKNGRIKHIGFSSHSAPETLERFLSWHNEFDMALIQMNYVDWTILDAKRQYEILTEHDIPIWVMEPLKGGRLSILNEKASGILKKAEPDKSISSWGLRFLMGLPNVNTVLSGVSSMEQLTDNVDTFKSCDPLSEDEGTILEKAKDVFLKDLGVPCSGCQYCCKTCPAELDIPLLIRGFNEYNVSGEFWRVAGLKNTKGSEACTQCGTCRKYCPQKIDIPEIMKKLQTIKEKG